MEIKYNDILAMTKSFEPELTKVISEVVASGWFLLGRYLETFEKAFAEYCGASHCIGVGNGLDAMKIILMAYKQLEHWNDGDEVIVPAHTFIASAESVVQSGLTPVFCDIRTEDALIDISRIESLISPRTRAVMCVHLYGKLCDARSLREITHKHHLQLLEDAAQAHGARTTENLSAGNLGDAAAFSFYPTKNLGALGDGGAIVTNHAELALVCRQIANYGQIRKYYHEYKGVNSRLDEIQAAVLNLKLQRLEEDNMRRKELARYYFEHINNPHIRLLYNGCYQDDSVYHIFPVLCRERDRLKQYLLSAGIETLIHYPVPPYRQKAFKEWNHLNMPSAEQISQQELSIPLHPFLSDEEKEFIVNTLNLFQC